MHKLGLIVLVCAACGAMPDGTPTGSTCPSTNQPTYNGFAQMFMARYCVGCHGATAENRYDAPLDQNFDTEAGLRAHRDEIDTVAAAGPNAVNTHMPMLSGPVHVAPTVTERQILGAFLACEAQE